MGIPPHGDRCSHPVQAVRLAVPIADAREGDLVERGRHHRALTTEDLKRLAWSDADSITIWRPIEMVYVTD